MRKVNLPLILGSIIILVLLVIIFFPGLFTDLNPYGTQMVKSYSSAQGQLKLEGAPFPPSADALLGTDEMGRDIYSLIIYGTRLTIGLAIMIVLGRFFVALPFGLLAGFGSKTASSIIKQFSIVFSAIPALLISVIILKLNFFLGLDKKYSFLAFVLVLTFVGWSKLALIIEERVAGILAQPFIKGEIAIGKSRLHLALGNVIPHLSAELIVLFFMEIANALTIIAQLGVFGVFVGNLRIVASTDNGVVIPLNISLEPEWASMLASSRNYFRSAPWMVLAPSVAFFISIFGFNLFGQGLKKELQKRDSRFIVRVRQILTFNPRTCSILNKGRQLRRHKQIVKLKPAGVSLFLIVLLILAAFPLDLNKDTNPASQALLSEPLPNEVLIGTPEAEETAEILAASLAGLGVEPLNEAGFISTYSTPAIHVPVTSDLAVVKDDSRYVLEQGVDYAWFGFGDFTSNGRIFDATELDLYSVKDFSVFDHKFVLVDSSFYSPLALSGLTEQILDNSQALGVFFILPEGQAIPESLGDKIYDGPAAWVSSSTAQLMLDSEQVEVTLDSRELPNTGRNVLGIIPGTDPKIGQEAIIIGTGYNYTADDAEAGQERIRQTLALAKELAPDTGRSIILAFWDGSLDDNYHGVYQYAQTPVISPQDSMLYLDLTGLESVSSSQLILSLDQAPLTRYPSWGFAHQLDLNYQEADVPLSYSKSRSFDEINKYGPDSHEAMYRHSGIPTISLTLPENHPNSANSDSNQAVNLETVFEVLLQTIENNKY